MELTIVRPTGSQILDINWLEAHTDTGNIVILPGHAPMVTLLAKNKEVLVELTDLTQMIMTISGGIVQVTRTSLVLLITQE